MSTSVSGPVRVLVIGAGKVGRLVARLLASAPEYVVTVADRGEAELRAAIPDGIATRVLDLAQPAEIARALTGQDYVVSCGPFRYNLAIAEAARVAGVAYLDLTEDVATTKGIAGLAEGAERAFIPQCGLAPGFIGIVAASLARSFETLDTVKLRVGALPLYPHNRLKYNLTWSTEGLINEYCNPCEAIVDGKPGLVWPLEGLERLSIDGAEYEAFHTSGGLGTLALTWRGRVRELDYKSIRYPGHRELISFLLHDLRLLEDRDTLRRLFERALPYTQQDVVIVFVTVTGVRNGRYDQQSYVRKIGHGEMFGEPWGAIQITTASSACAILDLHVQGLLPRSGFVRQEAVPLDAFLANRFGSTFA